MRRIRNAFLVFLTLWIGLPWPAANAHAGLVSSTPKSGAHLKVLPTQVKLQFEEDLLSLGEAPTNVLVIRDPDGVQIDKADSSISGRFLTVRLNPSSKVGIFTANWRVVSGDGHPVEGSFQFSVTSSPTATPMVSATPSPSATLPRTAVAHEEVGFWKQYQSRILLGTLLIIAIAIWARYKMKERAGRSD